MTGYAPKLPDWDKLTHDAFLGFLKDPSAYDYWRDWFKRKPRVRVPVERQLPNEADL